MGSFSRAAEGMNLSQPALSKGVRDFELQVGCRKLIVSEHHDFACFLNCNHCCSTKIIDCINGTNRSKHAVDRDAFVPFLL
ncbi:LysR family transcriptional regulator [Bradyrhizobium sp. CCGUVB1N3]|nr:LysR family transcriptional regulator [Bradyrhizobium sp. CCGUVB1N3]